MRARALIIAVPAAAVLAGGLGLALTFAADLLPCSGEQLSCNIEAAIGVSATLIAAGTGLLAFALALIIFRKRSAADWACGLLLLVLAVCFIVSRSETYWGLADDPYRWMRTVLVIWAPPLIAVVAQWLVVRKLVVQ
ncbi:hypothetical protein A7A08_00270 [Methyloligella halotolerans]|uniref:Uncharacterized protein n=1 Tax=Methyloligella halotolerans TaxID=1177755 RepID=A0A1E2S1T7_9HYPH|nr:hypothetical protein [Methyloligella halotolerans]ODA68447.1 hypothetical protein A7A08_00270 [Methyloligella halotolerans]